jgi:hypothetical protein
MTGLLVSLPAALVGGVAGYVGWRGLMRRRAHRDARHLVVEVERFLQEVASGRTS